MTSLNHLGLSWSKQVQVLQLLVEVQRQLPHVRTPEAKRRRQCMRARLIMAGLHRIGLLPAVGGAQ